MRPYFLLLLPSLCFGQGYADCSTLPGEKLVSVRLAYMEGRDEYSYRTLSGLKTQVVTFTTTKREVLISGARIDCVFSQPDTKSFEMRSTIYWIAPIKVSSGSSPTLKVTVEEMLPGYPGRWIAFIGNP